MKKIYRILIPVILVIILIGIFKLLPRYQNPYLKVNTSKTSLIVGEKDETSRLLDNIFIEDNRVLFSFENMNRFIDAYILKDEKYNQIISNSVYSTKIIDYINGTMREFLSNETQPIYIKNVENKMYFDIKELEDVYGINVEYIEKTNTVKISKDIHTYSVGKISEKASLKYLPSTLSATIDKLEQNDEVYVLRMDKEYYRVLDKYGRFGYVKQSSIVDIHDEKKYIPQNYGEKLNISWDYVNVTTPDRTDERKIEGLNILSPTWIDLLDKEGNVQDKSDNTYINWCKTNDYDIWVMFTNNSKIESTSNILNDTKLREKTIKNVLDICIKHNFSGINIDFENMYKADKDMFSQFIRELSVAFHKNNKYVSVDVTVPDGSDTWSLCFDRNAIGQAADYVVLMAYDQTPGGSQKPGSVAANNWVKTNIEKLLKEVDNTKLVLGVPFYTRIWKINSSGTTSYTIDMKSVNNYLVKNSLTKIWLEDEKQNYVEYTLSGNTYKIWLEDLDSMKIRLEYIKEYELAGIASWEKDREDANVWQMINSYLYK